MDEREAMTERIIDYLYGELSQAEAAEVLRLIENEPAWGEEHARLAAVMGELDRLQDVELPEDVSEEMEGRLAREGLLAGAAAGPRRGRWRTYRRAAALAAAVLLAAVGVWVMMKNLPAVAAGPVEVVPEKVAVTVFNENLALVKDSRFIVNCPKGDVEVRFADVAARIIADSVRFESRTDPTGTRVVEQNYEYDLATPDALLKRYIDRDVTCVCKDASVVQGKLLSFGPTELVPRGSDNVDQNDNGIGEYNLYDAQVELPQERSRTLQRGQMGQMILPLGRAMRPDAGSSDLVLKGPDGVVREVAREQLTSIRAAALPKGLLTRPTLVWKLRAKQAGRNAMQASYLTEGMGWRADYTAVIDGKGTLGLSGWVTITNESGSTYPNAELKLIAGDVNRVREEGTIYLAYGDVNGDGQVGAYRKPFEEKAFFEYHLYTLQGKTTLKDRQTKQIKLMDAQGVKFEKRYIMDAWPVHVMPELNDSGSFQTYSGNGPAFEQRNVLYIPAGTVDRVGVELTFKNEQKNGLGIPLPKGQVRVQMRDGDGELQEVTQQDIDHTAKDEEVKLGAGYATDVAGERKLVDFSQTGRQRFSSYEVTLRNHTDKAVQVIVRDHFSGTWAITKESEKGKSPEAFTYEWEVEVGPNEEKQVTYTVRES